MKVLCDNCKAQFVIDDSRVPETGMAVKCSQCQHLFVVKKSQEPLTVEPVSVDSISAAPKTEPEPYWTLRRTDGETFPFKEISTLQRWVVEHKALQYDEVSNDGRTWKKLIDLPELAPFLNIVKRATTGTMIAATQQESESLAPAMSEPSQAEMTPQTGTAVEENFAENQATEPPVASTNSEDPSESHPHPSVIVDLEKSTTSEQNGDTLSKVDWPEAKDGGPDSDVGGDARISLHPSDLIMEEDDEKEEVPESAEVPETEDEDALGIDAEEIEDTKVTAAPTGMPLEGDELEASTQDEAEVEEESVKGEEGELEELSSLDEDEEPEEKKEDEETDKKEIGEPSEVSESGPTDWNAPSLTVAEEWAEWDDEDTEASGKGGGLKVFAVLLILLVAGAVSVYLLKPELIDSLIKGGPSKELMEQVQQARVSLNLYSNDSMSQAESVLLKLLEPDQHPEFHQAIAMLSEVHASRADLLQYDIGEAERNQDALNVKIKEASKQFAEQGQTDTALHKNLADLNEQLKQANQILQEKTSRFNKEFVKAHEFANRAHELAPESLEANRALADYYRLGMDATKANDYLEKSLKLDPDDGVSIFIKGALFATDPALLADALRSLKIATMRDQTLIKAKFKVAHLHLKENKKEEANKFFQEILEQNPRHEPSKQWLEKNTVKPSEPELVKPVIEEKPAVKNKKSAGKVRKESVPGNYEGLMKAAGKKSRGDKPKAALKLYQKALAMKETPEVYTGIAYSSVDLGNLPAALSNFKKALNLSGRHSDAMFGIAMTYGQMGRKTQALNFYKEYLEYYPNGPDAGPAKTAIKLLE